MEYLDRERSYGSIADIVLGVGTPQSLMPNSPADDYSKHADIAAKGRRLPMTKEVS